MDLRRARGFGLLLAMLALVVGLAAPASAALRAPAVTYRVAGTNAVTLSGRTVTSSPRVRIDRYAGSGWRVLVRLRAHGHHFSATVPVPSGSTTTLRVTSNHRSRTLRVSMPAAAKPAPAPQPASDACGVQPRKADGTAWSCTFHDDFAGTALDRTKWTVATQYVTGDPSAFACAIDDPGVVSVASGSLHLSVRRVQTAVPCDIVAPGATTHYVAGTVSTAGAFDQAYGRFEARIRNTATDYPGLHEAFWLWPVDDGGVTWPASGEIDVSETYSVFPHNSYPRLHSADDDAAAGVNTAWDCAAERGTWNTYTLEWTPNRMQFFVNGKSCLTTTAVGPVFQKAYIPILTQALGAAYNLYDGNAPLPATMDVDYLRVWR